MSYPEEYKNEFIIKVKINSDSADYSNFKMKIIERFHLKKFRII